MKFKIEETKGYSIIPNYYLQDKNISLKAKGLLSIFYSLPKNWDYTVKGLCKITNTGITSIRSILSELEIYGYLIRTQERSEKGKFEYSYYIYTKPKKINMYNSLSLRKLKEKLK